MALLGWIPSTEGLPEARQPRLLHNESGKFESRFSNVQVQSSPAIMLKESGSLMASAKVVDNEKKLTADSKKAETRKVAAKKTEKKLCQ